MVEMMTKAMIRILQELDMKFQILKCGEIVRDVELEELSLACVEGAIAFYAPISSVMEGVQGSWDVCAMVDMISSIYAGNAAGRRGPMTLFLALTT